MASDISLEKNLPTTWRLSAPFWAPSCLTDKAIFAVLESLQSPGLLPRKPPQDFRENERADGALAPVDMITLKDELQRTEELESAGGPAYLASLTGRTAACRQHRALCADRQGKGHPAPPDPDLKTRS